MWENHLFQIAGATSDEKTKDFENWKEQRNEKTEDRTSKFEDQWRLVISKYVLEYLGNYIYLFVCILGGVKSLVSRYIEGYSFWGIWGP